MKYKMIVFGILLLISSALWAAEFPSASPFRSTAMINTYNIDNDNAAPASGFRSIASQPILGEDGFAQSPAELATTTVTTSPSKAKGIVNPEDDDEDKPNGKDDPIGDVLFPLLLMSLGYGLFLIFRSRAHEANGEQDN